MQLEHSFTVPAPVDEAWAILMDVERVAPCMPGATLTSHADDEFTGQVRVKLGPISVSYGMTGRFVVQDAEAHRAVIEARGKETRGSGTAAATIELSLVPEGDATNARAVIDLDITGRPAQFGRSTLADVSAALVAEFAGRLADTMSRSAVPDGDIPAASAQPVGSASPRATADANLDLLRIVAVPVLRRNGPPLVAVLAALLLLRRLWRRR